MSDSSVSPEPNPQIRQDISGNQNQTVGVVVGGVVVYLQVTQNFGSVETDPLPTGAHAQIGPNPYKGLLAFQETDGKRFFGRELQIQELWETFRSLHESESTTRVLIIDGPSGSGKSSLARAGLVPELGRRPLPGWDGAKVAVLVPGTHPLEALATVLAKIATNDSAPVAKTREFVDELKRVNSEGKHDGLRRIADVLPDITTSPLIVLVDQLEEVFTLCEDQAERDVFFGNLLCATRDRSKRVSAILMLRSDFLGSTQRYPWLNELINGQGYFVAAMSVEGLQEAITKPAKLAGHPLDQGTVSLLVEQTKEREGALPLLQFALTQIWAELKKGQEPAVTLTKIGGVGGALVGEAERIYQSLEVEDQEIARRVFLGLVQLGEGVKDTRRRTLLEQVVPYRSSREQVKKVIDRFAHRSTRLITLSSNARAETVEIVEITHEALLDHWPRLQEWLNKSRKDLPFQRRLDEAARRWQEHRQLEGNLWRSPDLDLLQQYHDSANDDMTELQIKFYRASKQSQARQKYLWRGIYILVLLLVSGFAIFALYYLHKIKHDQVKEWVNYAFTIEQPVDAAIYAIAAKGLSQSNLAQFPDRPRGISVDNSLLKVSCLANFEQNQLSDPKVKAAILSVAYIPSGGEYIAEAGAGAGTTGAGTEDWNGMIRIWDVKKMKVVDNVLMKHKQRIWSVSYRSDGQKIVSGSGDQTVKVWEAKTGKLINTFKGDIHGPIYSVSYMPNSKRIVSGGLDGKIRIWGEYEVNKGHKNQINGESGKPPILAWEGHKDQINSVEFSPNGRSIVSGSDDRTVRIWNSNTGQEIKTLKGHQKGVTFVKFSPDGKHIVSSSKDNTVRVWDAVTRQIVHILKGHTDIVWSASYSRDGKYIVSSSSDKTVRVWDATTGVLIDQPLIGHTNTVWMASFSPDQKHIVSASSDKTVRIWNAPMDKTVCKTFNGHSDSVSSVAFSPNGQLIVSGSADKTVRIWDRKAGIFIGKPLVGHDDKVTSVAFSPDGQRIISSSLDRTVRIWDIKTGNPIGKPLKKHTDEVSSVAFSPNGQRIISGSADKTVQVWDAKTGKALGHPFKGHDSEILSVAFSSHSPYIVSGSADAKVRIWDLKTGMSKILTRHDDTVTSVAFSPNGKLIASGSVDRTIRIWDLSTNLSKTLMGHDDTVTSVAFSRNGKLIVSGSTDKTVRIWDANTGNPIYPELKVYADSVTSVAFSPDSKHIIIGSSDRTVRIWDISNKEPLLNNVCNQLRYHINLIQPMTEVAREAKQTCERYVWK